MYPSKQLFKAYSYRGVAIEIAPLPHVEVSAPPHRPASCRVQEVMAHSVKAVLSNTSSKDVAPAVGQ